MKRVYLYGGSFNPPGIHHEELVEQLYKEVAEGGERILIIPCGQRTDKPSTNHISPLDRAAMIRMVFGRMGEDVELVLDDLERDVFTPTYDLVYHSTLFDPTQEQPWIVVGQDLIDGGATGDSEIQRDWYRGRELWERANFLVITRGDRSSIRDHVPPHHEVVVKEHNGSSRAIRNAVFHHQPFEHLVSPEIAVYIKRCLLYTGSIRPNPTSFKPTGRAKDPHR